MSKDLNSMVCLMCGKHFHTVNSIFIFCEDGVKLHLCVDCFNRMCMDSYPKCDFDCECCQRTIDDGCCVKCKWFTTISGKDVEYNPHDLDIVYVCKRRHYIPHAYSCKCHHYEVRDQKVQIGEQPCQQTENKI